MKRFNSILEFNEHFCTEEKCREYLVELRWGKTVCCTVCASVNVTAMKDGKRFQCNEKECRSQFSITSGTPMENTKIPLRKWFLAMYLMSTHKKGLSSLQLASWLNLTPKSAWYLSHRVREMFHTEEELLDGIVECDETMVGGKMKNKHSKQRQKMTGMENKTVVFGAISRTGSVKTMIIPDSKDESIKHAVRSTVKNGCVLITDEKSGYAKLRKEYRHAKINHSQGEYARGAAYTNNIENFWSHLKRKVLGVHHTVTPKHLQRYCDEAAYKFNVREMKQDAVFAYTLSNCNMRLGYNNLIN